VCVCVYVLVTPVHSPRSVPITLQPQRTQSHIDPGQTPSQTRYAAEVCPFVLCAGELQGPALIRVALLTLGTFDFGQYNLLEFVRDHVMTYLDDPAVSIRRSSAAAAAQVLQRHVAKHSQLQNGVSLNGQFLPLTNVSLPCLPRPVQGCCAVLCRAVLCHAVLCCAVLYAGAWLLGLSYPYGATIS